MSIDELVVAFSKYDIRYSLKGDSMMSFTEEPVGVKTPAYIPIRNLKQTSGLPDCYRARRREATDLSPALLLLAHINRPNTRKYVDIVLMNSPGHISV